MAIIVDGMMCSLCGKPIEKGQQIIAFASFVANELDPLWIFNDGAFHSECFYKHPLAEKAQARQKEVLEQLGPGNRFCVVCKRKIIDHDDYFTLGHLTEDERHPLYRYNYVQAHRSHLSKWSELPYVYELIVDLERSSTWRGNTLNRLLIELRESLPPHLAQH
jgi:predicted nucleic acid-binding Zn ribbon protein